MTIPFGQVECWCGKPYTPNCDGRNLHRRLFDHTPTPTKEPTQAVETEPWRPVSSRCNNLVHSKCLGRCVDDHGEKVACGCKCHEGGGAA